MQSIDLLSRHASIQLELKILVVGLIKSHSFGTAAVIGMMCLLLTSCLVRFSTFKSQCMLERASSLEKLTKMLKKKQVLETAQLQ